MPQSGWYDISAPNTSGKDEWEDISAPSFEFHSQANIPDNPKSWLQSYDESWVNKSLANYVPEWMRPGAALRYIGDKAMDWADSRPSSAMYSTPARYGGAFIHNVGTGIDDLLSPMNIVSMGAAGTAYKLANTARGLEKIGDTAKAASTLGKAQTARTVERVLGAPELAAGVGRLSSAANQGDLVGMGTGVVQMVGGASSLGPWGNPTLANPVVKPDVPMTGMVDDVPVTPSAPSQQLPSRVTVKKPSAILNKQLRQAGYESAGVGPDGFPVFVLKNKPEVVAPTAPVSSAKPEGDLISFNSDEVITIPKEKANNAAFIKNLERQGIKLVGTDKEGNGLFQRLVTDEEGSLDLGRISELWNKFTDGGGGDQPKIGPMGRVAQFEPPRNKFDIPGADPDTGAANPPLSVEERGWDQSFFEPSTRDLTQQIEDTGSLAELIQNHVIDTPTFRENVAKQPTEELLQQYSRAISHGDTSFPDTINWMQAVEEVLRGRGINTREVIQNIHNGIEPIYRKGSDSWSSIVEDEIRAAYGDAPPWGPEYKTAYPDEIIEGVDTPRPPQMGQQELPVLRGVPSDTPASMPANVANPTVPDASVQPTFWDSIKDFVGDESGHLDLSKLGGSTPPKPSKVNEETSVLREAYNLPRGATTTMDISAPLRQGFPLLATKAFWKSWVPMFQSLGSEAAFQKTLSDLKARKMFQNQIDLNTGKLIPSMAEQWGVRLSEIGTKLSRREEALASNWIENGKFLGGENALQRGYQKTLGKAARASNRAYTAFLNQLRADTLDNLISDAKALHDADKRLGLKDSKNFDPYTNIAFGKEIGDFVNTATGRGHYAQLLRT